MKALPNTNVPLFDASGAAAPILRQILDGLPRGALVDSSGRPLRDFSRYLASVATTPLPNVSVALADDQGRPTRTLTMLLKGVP